jgi:hypothetical protein
MCGCYSWEMALNDGFDASSDNMCDRKEILEKIGKINNMKT